MFYKYCEEIKFAMHVFLVFVIISVNRKDKTKLCINTHLETSNSRDAAIIKWVQIFFVLGTPLPIPISCLW